MGAAGLLTLACSLKSGISQQFLHRNETYGKAQGEVSFS